MNVDEIKRLFPNASASLLRRNTAGSDSEFNPKPKANLQPRRARPAAELEPNSGHGALAALQVQEGAFLCALRVSAIDQAKRKLKLRSKRLAQKNASSSELKFSKNEGVQPWDMP